MMFVICAVLIVLIAALAWLEASVPEFVPYEPPYDDMTA
jgi:hypothetical protein